MSYQPIYSLIQDLKRSNPKLFEALGLLNDQLQTIVNTSNTVGPLANSCLVLGTGQTVVSGTPANLTFNKAQFVRNNVWNIAAPTKFVIPESGLYLITAQTAFISLVTGSFELVMLVNGSVPTYQPTGFCYSASATLGPIMTLSSPYKLNIHDVLTFSVFQNTGSNQNTAGAQTLVGITYLGS